VPGPFEQQWWMRQPGRRVEEALVACDHTDLRVVFVVEPLAETAVG
jgi:hypothetical protein